MLPWNSKWNGGRGAQFDEEERRLLEAAVRCWARELAVNAAVSYSDDEAVSCRDHDIRAFENIATSMGALLGWDGARGVQTETGVKPGPLHLIFSLGLRIGPA